MCETHTATDVTSIPCNVAQDETFGQMKLVHSGSANVFALYDNDVLTSEMPTNRLESLQHSISQPKKFSFIRIKKQPFFAY